MADRTLASVTMITADFRAALQSASAHTQTGKDALPLLTRTHLVLDPVLVWAMATNRYSAGVAIASVEEDHTSYGDEVHVDLLPDQVRELLALFPGKDGTGDSAMPTSIRLDITDTYLTAVDVTGLFPGKTMRWPRAATEDQYPDLRTLVGSRLDLVGTATAVQLHTNGALMALFGVPSRLYAKPLVVEPTEGGALLVSCGESFVGLLQPVTPGEEGLAEERGWRQGWKRRLGIEELVPT